MVGLRNRIMHGNEDLNEFDFPDIKAVQEDEIEFQLQTKTNPIDELDKLKCLDFGKVLGHFKKYIVEPWFEKDLEENRLLIKNKN